MYKEKRKSNGFSRAGERQAVVCVSGKGREALVRRRALWAVLLCALWVTGWLAGCRDRGSAVVIQGTSIAEETTEGEAVLDSDQVTTSLSDMSQQESAGTASNASQQESAGSPTNAPQETTAPSIYVHICGQVCTPGVYELPEGSRVWDAVLAAGGLTEEAQPEAVNLALRVVDGSKVIIPDEQEAQQEDFCWYATGTGQGAGTDGGSGGAGTAGGATSGSASTGSASTGSASTGTTSAEGTSGTASGQVDINQATVEQLMTIPGIGQTRAEAIVAYRQTQGRFGSIEDIMKVTGIKEGLFATIREYITVGG